MIPKIIHYCWFGGKEIPEQLKKYMASWKKYCPDYELKLWNEENFDINSNQYVREAYENKKYAFVTDYVRLFALYNYGGIYMDTDVEILKPLDGFVQNKAFFGFESKDYIQTALIGSEPSHPIIKEFLDYYSNRHFINNSGECDTTTNVKIITKILKQHDLKLNNEIQNICDAVFYPSDYFCPIDWKTKKKNVTKNTYAIHWFEGSWIQPKSAAQKLKDAIKKPLNKIFGKEKTKKIIKFLKGERDI